MEFILELLAGWFGHRFVSSKKLKPGVKTAIASVVVLLVTALFANGVYLTWTIQESVVGTVVMAVLTAAVFAVGGWFVWTCHKNRWETE